VITIEQYITRLAQQGMDIKKIKEQLFKDFAEGGQLFGQLKNSIQQQVLYTINNTNTFVKIEQLSDRYYEQDYTWIAVVDKKTCPDCAPRHLMVKSLKEWEDLGLPGTGWSYCREFCRCSIVPTQALTKEDLSRMTKPIDRKEIDDFKKNVEIGKEKWDDVL